MVGKVNVLWLSKPQEHDYIAAGSFLSLLYEKKFVSGCVKKLELASMREFKAKDIFRASALPLLGLANSHVKADKEKIDAKQKISPLLLVRDSKNGKVIIADGYHRLCAVYYYDEDAIIPCKII